MKTKAGQLQDSKAATEAGTRKAEGETLSRTRRIESFLLMAGQVKEEEEEEEERGPPTQRC